MVDRKEQLYYKCYSYRQMKFIQAHGVEVLSSDINERTQNRYWLYEMNDNLSDILTRYSEIYTTNKE